MNLYLRAQLNLLSDIQWLAQPHGISFDMPIHTYFIIALRCSNIVLHKHINK